MEGKGVAAVLKVLGVSILLRSHTSFVAFGLSRLSYTNRVIPCGLKLMHHSISALEFICYVTSTPRTQISYHCTHLHEATPRAGGSRQGWREMTPAPTSPGLRRPGQGGFSATAFGRGLPRGQRSTSRMPWMRASSARATSGSDYLGDAKPGKEAALGAPGALGAREVAL